MAQLVRISDFNCFSEVRDFSETIATDQLKRIICQLDEREELEPFLMSILSDPNETPHGPAELVDILTHRVALGNEKGIAAFILKGKSFPVVRPKHVSHQIYRLEKISGLKFAVLVAPGKILDEAKEQFISTCERLHISYSIFDAVDLARLFVAYGFFCPRDYNRITVGKCYCGYSPKDRVLNIFQTDAIRALKDAHSIGQTSGLIVLPTGSGKTRIAAHDAKVHGTKILYLGHTHELLQTAQAEFESKFSKNEVVMCQKPSHLSNLKTVNISTIQFLNRNRSKVTVSSFDYVIVDEFHHAAAKSYRNVIDRIQPQFLLGLTATPFRGDRQDISALCGNNILVNYELRTGIEMGILSPYHYYGCFDDVNYSRIHHNGMRYDIRDLEKALIIPARDRAIVEKWQQLARDLPTIAFCCSKRHAIRMAKSFEETGIPAATYINETVWSDRLHLIDKFRSGQLKVLCVVDILNEGVDLPFVECLLFLRPTESKRVFFQQLGRGLRKYVGKSHCIVIDFIGNFRNSYKIVEYQGLTPIDGEETTLNFTKVDSMKEVLNLPMGCKVNFDEKVIDIFARQTLNPRHATRHNIGRILMYQYLRLRKILGRVPTKKDVDQNLILSSDFYENVFGSWKKFEEIISPQTEQFYVDTIGVNKVE